MPQANGRRKPHVESEKHAEGFEKRLVPRFEGARFPTPEAHDAEVLGFDVKPHHHETAHLGKVGGRHGAREGVFRKIGNAPDFQVVATAKRDRLGGELDHVVHRAPAFGARFGQKLDPSALGAKDVDENPVNGHPFLAQGEQRAVQHDVKTERPGESLPKAMGVKFGERHAGPRR